MKTSKLPVILISFFCLIIISCSSSSDSSSGTTSSTTEGYTRETMPGNTAVQLPSSLTSQASSSSRTANASLSDSMGLLQIQTSVSFMKLFLSEAESTMIIWDAAISQSKMSVGKCYASNEVTVTFTEEMLQSLKDVYSKIDSEMSSDDLAKYSSWVGTEIVNTVPISYVTTTNRGFDKILNFGSSSASCSGTAVSYIDEVIMWSDNKNKLQFTFDLNSSSQVFFGTLAYDGSTNTSSFDFYMKTSSFDAFFSGIFMQCNSGVDDCVTVRMIMGKDAGRLESRGRVDDNGGYTMSRFNSSALGLNFWFKEHWDTTLKSQVSATTSTGVSTCNASWDNVSNCTFDFDMLNAQHGETSSSSGLRNYEVDAGKIFSQHWIATPSKTSAFLADSVGQGYALMTTPGSTNLEDIGGAAVKLDNLTVGFVVYFEPTSGDNFTMQDLGGSASNRRDISSTAVDNLTLTYACASNACDNSCTVNNNTWYRLTNSHIGTSKALDTYSDYSTHMSSTAGDYSGQYWQFTSLGDEYYRLTNRYLTENALDTYSECCGTHMSATAGDYSGQYWRITSLDGGYCRLTNKYLTGYALDTNADTHVPFMSETARDYSGQYWKFTAIETIQ